MNLGVPSIHLDSRVGGDGSGSKEGCGAVSGGDQEIPANPFGGEGSGRRQGRHRHYRMLADVFGYDKYADVTSEYAI